MRSSSSGIRRPGAVIPLADECDSLEEAIALERRMLSPLRERAAHIIDTSGLTARGLRAKLLQLFARGPAERSMEVRVTSFGFKHGIPMEADLVFDVRFLPNPYYVAELRPRTGLDDGVRDYALSAPSEPGVSPPPDGLCRLSAAAVCGRRARPR